MEIEEENGVVKSYQDIRSIGQNEELSVSQELESLHQTFKGLKQHYKVVDKIGEGTFSSVYKAVDLQYDLYPSEWDQDHWYQTENKANHLVAIKRIYVTSSPSRIANELQLLYKLRNCKHVSRLITALRDKDQVLVILPYFEHTGFHLLYRYADISECRKYMRQLFLALSSVHGKGIIHRDIKPNNFLYNWVTGKGILVDFGLAERESDSTSCACKTDGVGGVIPYKNQGGYRKDDRRSSRRANRAGTRGYRAPEVLFRCLSQTGKIDIWSAGVILLTILTHRSPLFNSLDDADAMIEIATIFGKSKLQSCALLHGTVFETSIPLPNHGMSLSEFVKKFRVTKHNNTNNTKNGNSRGMTNNNDEYYEDERMIESFSPAELLALDLAKRCLEVDFRKRYSAKQALMHEFFREDDENDYNNSGTSISLESSQTNQEASQQANRHEPTQALESQTQIADKVKNSGASRDEGADTEKLDTSSEAGGNPGDEDENDNNNYQNNDKDE